MLYRPIFPISPHHQVCWSKIKLNLFTFCGGGGGGGGGGGILKK